MRLCRAVRPTLGSVMVVDMPPAIATTPIERPGDAMAPLRLPEDLLLSVEQFAAVCHANPDAVLKLFDSSTGFRLPDGSVLSPDASLIRQERWQALSADERRGFAPLCPDLVAELASSSDEGPRGLTALRRKMATYQANGAQLGWLLIPEQQTVEVWPAQGSGEPSRLNAATSLDAGPLFPGLQIELQEIWHV